MHSDKSRSSSNAPSLGEILKPEAVVDRNPETVQQEVWRAQERRESDRFAGALRFLRSHVGVVTSVVLFFLVGVRIVAAARWDWDTARGLVSAGTPLSTLLPALLSILAVIAPAVALSAVFVVWRPHRPPHMRRRLRTNLFVLAALLPMAFLSPWPLTIGVVVFSLIYAFIADRRAQGQMEVIRRATKGDESALKQLQELEPRKRPTLSVYLVLVLLLMFIVDDQPWLPTEAVGVADDTIVGYVVSATESDLVVLREADRALVRLRHDDVISREFCTLASVQASLYQLLERRRPTYPLCADR